MKQEDKDLLLKDLCMRLPYGVIFKDEFDESLQEIHYIKNEDVFCKNYPHLPYWIETTKPYLRPMSSMTNEELKEYNYLYAERENNNEFDDIKQYSDLIDWLNEHHIDYRGLIPKGLALEAPNGMYT